MQIIFTVMLLFLFALYGYICFKNIKFAALLFTALLPTYLIRFSVGSIPSTALEALFFILFSSWIIKKQYKKIPTNGLKNWILPLLLLLVTACISVITAPDTFSALGILKAYYIEPIIAGLIFLSIFKKNDWKDIFAFFSIGAMVVVAFG
ncbi:hypothetical protein KJ766_04060, partial [Patescibacteria group bacterium]|nr:hypothetical protein [Patescibacteria group bacterium]